MLQIKIRGHDLILNTHPQLFSPNGLDRGTLAMLSVVQFQVGQRVLDLGCGYGAVGILAAKLVGAENVVMVDNDPLAVQVSKENLVLNRVSHVTVCQSNGFSNLRESNFDLILSNPPYHTDFSVPKEFIEKGLNRLVIGGKMYMVTKRKEWYKNKFIAIFGGVRVCEVDGYYVFMAEKKSVRYASSKKGRIREGRISTSNRIVKK